MLKCKFSTASESARALPLASLPGVVDWNVVFVVDPALLPPSSGGLCRLCGDNSKITALTAWRPEVSLREGISRTVKWFTDPANLARYKTDIYNR